jgi:DNA-binding NtrC family response regulator
VNLRILFVEDSPNDMELMLWRLRQAGIEPQWDRVQSEAALREALVGEQWQVALVDYNLPGFGGLLLAEAAPDVPAITVSGAITEEMAVATITAGAVDYVLKDNLTRLAPVVRRAVEGAEVRREQRRAAAQARRTQLAIEHSSQAVATSAGTAPYCTATSPLDVSGQSILRGWSARRSGAGRRSLTSWSGQSFGRRLRGVRSSTLRARSACPTGLSA